MLIENIVQDPSDREERATHHGGWFTQCHTASVRRKGTRGGLIFSGCGERCWSPISNHDSASNSCSKPKPTSSTCITRFCRVSISKTRRSASTSSTAPTRASDRTPPSRSPTPTVGKPSQTRKGRWPSVMPPLKGGKAIRRTRRSGSKAIWGPPSRSTTNSTGRSVSRTPPPVTTRSTTKRRPSSRCTASGWSTR